ncbi:hypothetical protein KSP40_PGU003473 [Platanthera guangdongensis]|uniref:Uncharacterized protein n=1 Tax=Platanthera guangdongensis TaxID=2320717 RepID=A0ABR2MIX3_9ASPA
MNHPLHNILEGVEHTGRLTKWSVELSEFHISFVPRLYIVEEALNSGGYRLHNVEGISLGPTWSGDDLKHFYP